MLRRVPVDLCLTDLLVGSDSEIDSQVIAVYQLTAHIAEVALMMITLGEVLSNCPLLLMHEAKYIFFELNFSTFLTTLEILRLENLSFKSGMAVLLSISTA